MEVHIQKNRLRLISGDITKVKTDCIVNAANGTLYGGGGVDGAIHRAAGPKLLDECKVIRKEQLKGEYLPTGEAVMTKGYELPAKFVIHTVGPIWDGKDVDEKGKLLAHCYRNSLLLAKEKGLHSIAFPSISTGAYRFPIEMAAEIALKEIIQFLQEETFGDVYMVLFSEKDYNIYKQTLERLMENV
ncbi:O-acetyl-ADP-ribose deacetylase [Fervidibacillus halotolerans]|uniref:O-acetyl-ADP-ribose deacetylase n=1 Tax=Fervidibacillus halotolerans TaxID=2980027 RepID=A0A9E8S1D8_9BACI|nr:O-acetyl-ADP-ribose deacetylase [Fervidibacillus halotolerans]WAA13427.1 O-acetyl-ADP-ribose deacetylase [Fervidibacillus halotolerans]